LYLIDKDGFRYGFNADMAKHTNLYAVMQDGVRVPWTGSPPVQGGPASTVVLAEDKFPTEAELLQAKALQQQSSRDKQAEQIAMAAQAAQSGQGGSMPGSVRIPQAQPVPSVEGNEYEAVEIAPEAVEGRMEPPSTVGGTVPVSDYQADMPLNPAPAAPPLPPRRAPPRPSSRA
jgi:hypothetical protein